MTEMDSRHGNRDITIRDLPDAVDAGAQAVLRIEVSADPVADLTGQDIQIVDAAGAIVAEAPLAPVTGTGDLEADTPARYTTPQLAFRAPATPGLHRYAARLTPFAVEGVSYPETEADLSLTVVAHRIAPVVWDIPEAIAPGATFTLRVGASCAGACDATGWAVTIRDANGATLGAAALGARSWPGTEGLHYAEVALTAPDVVGLATWEAVVAAPDASLPHEGGRRRFGVRTTPPTDAALRIEAIDAKSGAPIEGLKVIVHPFSARTGPDGSAELALPAGTHRIFVSGRHYLPVRDDRTIAERETIRVLMEPDTGPSDAQIWG